MLVGADGAVVSTIEYSYTMPPLVPMEIVLPSELIAIVLIILELVALPMRLEPVHWFIPACAEQIEYPVMIMVKSAAIKLFLIGCNPC